MEERNERSDHLLKEMKRPFEDLMSEVTALKANNELTIAKNKPSIDESIFSLSSVSSKDVFSSEDVESDQKIIDENKESELEEQHIWHEGVVQTEPEHDVRQRRLSVRLQEETVPKHLRNTSQPGRGEPPLRTGGPLCRQKG